MKGNTHKKKISTHAVTSDYTEEMLTKYRYLEYTDSPLFCTLKPLFYSMKLLGLFYYKDYVNSSNLAAFGTHGKKRRKITFSEIYATIMLVIMWINVVRMMLVFHGDDTFGSQLFNKINLVTWYIFGSINITVNFRSCSRYNCLPRFFVKWSKLNPYIKPADLKTMQKAAVICTVGWWSSVVFSIVADIYGGFHSDLFHGSLTPINPTHPYASIFTFFIGVINVYLYSTWTFSLVLHLIVCIVNYYQFNKINQSIISCIQANGKFNGDVEESRGRHQGACKLISHADDFFALYNASLYIATIINICLLMYTMIWQNAKDEDYVSLSIKFYWLIMYVLILIINLVCGGYVNHKVSRK